MAAARGKKRGGVGSARVREASKIKEGRSVEGRTTAFTSSA
jgi:hypothetical protein